jgi:hypothetical protein
VDEVTTKVAARILPALKTLSPTVGAAAESLVAPGGLGETLRDPLRAATQGLLGERSEPTTAEPQGKLPGGEKVLRTTFLDGGGKVPWGQIETMLGLTTEISGKVRAGFQAQVSALKLEQPYVEVILDGADAAVQIEDLERIVAGPAVIAPGYANPAEDATPDTLRVNKDAAVRATGEVAALIEDGRECADAIRGELRNAASLNKDPSRWSSSEKSSNVADAGMARARVDQLTHSVDRMALRAERLIEGAGGTSSAEGAALAQGVARAREMADAAARLLGELESILLAHAQKQTTDGDEAEQAQEAAPPPVEIDPADQVQAPETA